MKYCSTVEENFCISAQPCNILYIFNTLPIIIIMVKCGGGLMVSALDSRSSVLGSNPAEALCCVLGRTAVKLGVRTQFPAKTLL